MSDPQLSLEQSRALRNLSLMTDNLEECDDPVEEELLFRAGIEALRLVASLEYQSHT